LGIGSELDERLNRSSARLVSSDGSVFDRPGEQGRDNRREIGDF
jgi:hypothetical protein